MALVGIDPLIRINLEKIRGPELGKLTVKYHRRGNNRI